MNIDNITTMLAENLDRGFSNQDKNDIITGRELAYMVGCGEIYDEAAKESDNAEEDNDKTE